MKKLISLLLLLVVGAGSVQAAPIDSIAYFFKYHRSTVPEKLYLTTDRPYYEAGDTLWFRGTLVSADNHSYLIKSNYIYVELMNRSNQTVMRRKVLREDLCFQHCLPLPFELLSGEYTLCAYTSWMRNFDSDFFFNRKLTIVNRNVPPVGEAPVAHDYAVSFFPEGGVRVAGQVQRVALKAVAVNGLPEAVTGRVLSASGRELATFATLHDGMGAFTLPADAGAGSLTVEVTAAADGMRKTFALPAAPAAACALTVVRQDETSLDYRILASADFPTDSLLLIAHSGSRVVACLTVAPGSGGTLSLQSCRDGISHLVLATLAGQGLSRRLIFCRNKAHDVSSTMVAQWKPTQPREAVTLKLHLQDASGAPLRGDYCISVTDGGLVNCAFDSLRDNILSNLLMTSDLKGYIHRPAWYFAGGQDVALQQSALDLLMMTHGWCRFSTDQIAQAPQLEFPEPLEEKEWLSGRVLHLKRSDKEVAISVVDTTGNSFGSGRLDEQGAFFIGDLNYPDRAVLNVRLLSTGKNPQFVFDSFRFPELTRREPFRLDFADYVAAQAESELMIGRDGMRTMMLDNIVVTDQRKSRSPFFKGIVTERWHNADYIDANYDLYQYDDALSLVNQMIENEWSMYIDPIDNFGDFHTDNGTAAASHTVTTGWGALGTFVIGDAHYNNADAAVGVLERLHSEDVERVEVINQMENLIEPGAGKAVLVVCLKPGTKLIEGVEERRMTTHRAFGYTLPAYFYQPVYERAEDKEVIELDLRKTLFWDPSFQTDASGDATLQFYNSDHVGPRHVVIEGVTFKGRPVRIEQILQ